MVYTILIAPLARLLVLSGVLSRLPGIPEKLRRTLDLKRETWPKWPDNRLRRRPIWVHFASGELEYAKPCLREIKRLWPDQPVLGTFGSVSVEGAARRLTELDLVMPLPIDHPGEWDRFHELYRPIACLVARTDLWPLMAESCRKRGLSILLFSATFGPGSHRIKRWLGPLLQRPLELSDIHLVHENDLTELRLLSRQANRAIVSGDTRYDQVLWRLAQSRQWPKPLNQVKARWPRHATWTLGSLWPEDWRQLKPLLGSWLQESSENRAVIVPHEPSAEFLAEIESDLRDLGRPEFTRLTNPEACIEPGPGSTRVLLVDQVGWLAETYQTSALAFVGGSFVRRVHSVMEPLAAGCLTLVGPYHSNNREALEFQNQPILADSRCPVQVLTPSDLVQPKARIDELRRCLSHPLTPELIVGAVAARGGATAKVIDWLRPAVQSAAKLESHRAE
jgi:3-deoxy-D-manno-octulosonic-acid transferase